MFFPKSELESEYRKVDVRIKMIYIEQCFSNQILGMFLVIVRKILSFIAIFLHVVRMSRRHVSATGRGTSGISIEQNLRKRRANSAY